MKKSTLAGRLRDGANRLGEGPVTFAQLAGLHGQSLQGAMLVLLATPCVLPIPGIGNVLGMALMSMAVAMWRGNDGSRLPARLGEIELSGRWARRMLGVLARFYELAERWSRHRLEGWLLIRHRSWLAANVGLMGAVIFLPIPLGNVLPALAIVLLGLGLALRDGLSVLAGWIVSVVAILYTAALSVGLWVWLIEPVRGWFD